MEGQTRGSDGSLLGNDRTGTRYYDFDEKDEDHGFVECLAQTLVEAPPPGQGATDRWWGYGECIRVTTTVKETSQ